jgi:hypothetical protein
MAQHHRPPLAPRVARALDALNATAAEGPHFPIVAPEAATYLNDVFLRAAQALELPEHGGAFALDVPTSWPDVRARYEAIFGDRRCDLQSMRSAAQHGLYVRSVLYNPHLMPIAQAQVAAAEAKVRGLPPPAGAAASADSAAELVVAAAAQFQEDCEVIEGNCIFFNGPSSEFGALAAAFGRVARQRCRSLREEALRWVAETFPNERAKVATLLGAAGTRRARSSDGLPTVKVEGEVAAVTSEVADDAESTAPTQQDQPNTSAALRIAGQLMKPHHAAASGRGEALPAAAALPLSSLEAFTEALRTAADAAAAAAAAAAAGAGGGLAASAAHRGRPPAAVKSAPQPGGGKRTNSGAAQKGTPAQASLPSVGTEGPPLTPNDRALGAAATAFPGLCPRLPAALRARLLESHVLFLAAGGATLPLGPRVPSALPIPTDPQKPFAAAIPKAWTPALQTASAGTADASVNMSQPQASASAAEGGDASSASAAPALPSLVTAADPRPTTSTLSAPAPVSLPAIIPAAAVLSDYFVASVCAEVGCPAPPSRAAASFQSTTPTRDADGAAGAVDAAVHAAAAALRREVEEVLLPDPRCTYARMLRDATPAAATTSGRSTGTGGGAVGGADGEMDAISETAARRFYAALAASRLEADTLRLDGGSSTADAAATTCDSDAGDAAVVGAAYRGLHAALRSLLLAIGHQQPDTVTRAAAARLDVLRRIVVPYVDSAAECRYLYLHERPHAYVLKALVAHAAAKDSSNTADQEGRSPDVAWTSVVSSEVLTRALLDVPTAFASVLRVSLLGSAAAAAPTLVDAAAGKAAAAFAEAVVVPVVQGLLDYMAVTVDSHWPTLSSSAAAV